MTDTLDLWTPDTPFPSVETLPLPARIEHVVLYRGQAPFAFLHESAITRHGDGFIVAWNNSPEAESARGTEMRWIRADAGFTHWSAPRPLAPALDHETEVWESVQLLSTEGALWAFVGQVRAQPRSPANAGGRMVIFRFDEKREAWQPRGTVEGFHPLNRPQPLAGGGWIMGGQYNLAQPRVAISDGPDVTRWEVVAIPTAATDRIAFAETSLIVDADRITAHVRSAAETLYVSESRDGGRQWLPVRASNFPAADSKTSAGRFSTGQRFLACNPRQAPEDAKGRDVLAVAVSAPGEAHFRKLVRLRAGRAPEPRAAGFAKRPQWSYPAVEEADGRVFITYSISKEDCGLSILPLSAFHVDA